MFFGNVSGGEAGGGIFTLDTSGIREDIVWLVDGPFGIEQGVITTVVLLGAIVMTIGFVKSDRMVQAARTRRDRTVERGML